MQAQETNIDVVSNNLANVNTTGYKRSRATQNARVFTNEDIQRLNARNDVNTMGANQDQTLPQGEGEVEATAPPQQPQQPVKGQKRSPFTPKQPK